MNQHANGEGFVFTSHSCGEVRRSASRPAVHEYAALSFSTSGSATFEQREEWSFTEGDMMLIPAGSPHRLIRSDAYSFWGLGFFPASLYAEGLGELLSLFDAVRGGASARLNIRPERRDFLQSLFVELEAAVRARASLTVQKSLVALILEEAKRAASLPSSPPPTDIVSQALRYIEQQCLRPISLVDVAAFVGRSPAHLTTSVRQQTGRSVQEWIIRGRLIEAQRLLRSKTSLDEIALRVGYSDARHLTRLFTREYKETPAQYRTRYKSNQ
jgi:AraC family transcriptional activator of pobA